MNDIVKSFNPAAPPRVHPQSKMGFERLHPNEAVLCLALGKRAANFVIGYKREHQREDLLDPDALLIACDFACAHLARNLRLGDLMMANDLDFMHDFVAITTACRARLDATFPADVHLRYAIRRN